jgi:hypothetical protein
MSKKNKEGALEADITSIEAGTAGTAGTTGTAGTAGTTETAETLKTDSLVKTLLDEDGEEELDEKRYKRSQLILKGNSLDELYVIGGLYYSDYKFAKARKERTGARLFIVKRET